MQAIGSMLDKALGLDKTLGSGALWQIQEQNFVPILVKGGLLVSAIAAILGARHWWIDQTMPPPRQVKIQQTWELEPGERIADYRIIGGLGDVSLALGGGSVHAPFAGEVYPFQERCVLFSSPEVPAYMFRFCGLRRVAFGEIRQGGTIGRARSLHFATLRKQPDGSWAIVEPAREILEKILAPGKG